jgi:hypothetical protein
MTRKLLFVCFSDDECRLTHAMWWAGEAHDAGHEVKILLEGLGTRCLTWLSDPEMKGFAQAFSRVKELGLIAGVCQAASSGCAGEAGKPKPIEAARTLGLVLKNTLNGHAGIAEFLQQGFEVITF